MDMTTGRLTLVAIATVAAIGAGAFFSRHAVAEQAVHLPPPVQDIAAAPSQTETAVFAGGCFWGVQAVFQHTRGVLNAVSGYAGGDAAGAKYELVSSGRTGHAEAVQVTYDPKQVSYGKLLQVFYSVAHDPTTLNRQGPDAGPQYRSVIFHKDAQQKRIAEAYIAQLDSARLFRSRIVTQVAPLTAFYPAEAYHQDYATRNPHQPYIATFDRPKIENLKAVFPQLYRDKPVLVGEAARKPAP
jgi:peptide-methionine (S)-S-oxide reductase